MSRVGMRGALTPRSIARMAMHGAPMPGSMRRMPMHRAPMMNSALGLRRFNRFNDGAFNRDDRFRRFRHFNEIIFISQLRLSMVVGVLGRAGTGATTHTEPTDIPIRRSTTPATDMGMVTMAMVMRRPAMITDMSTRRWSYYGSYYSGANYGNDDESLCAMFSPNTKFLGTAMTWPASVVSSLKTMTT
jgi:hypothetical protein